MFSEFELKSIQRDFEKFLQNRFDGAHVKNLNNISYRIEKQSVEIFSKNPSWNDKSQMVENPIAKATFIKKSKVWKIYWQRADLKCHSYEPNPIVNHFSEFIQIVEKDEFGCFLG